MVSHMVPGTVFNKHVPIHPKIEVCTLCIIKSMTKKQMLVLIIILTIASCGFEPATAGFVVQGVNL